MWLRLLILYKAGTLQNLAIFFISVNLPEDLMFLQERFPLLVTSVWNSFSVFFQCFFTTF